MIVHARFVFPFLLACGAVAPRCQQLVGDLAPGTAPQSSSPELFLGAGDRVFFRAQTTTEGQELWVTDGTAGGTRMVIDLVPGAGSSGPVPLLAVGGRLLFSATLPGLGTEPWVTDGTAAGTFLLADLEPGANNGEFVPVGLWNDSAVFTAIVHTKGWFTLRADLRSRTLRVLANVPAVRGSGYAHGDRFYFQVLGATAREPWVSDGTETGTRPIPGFTGHDPTAFLAVGGRVCFCAYAGASLSGVLWTTDGTAAGTMPLRSLPYVSSLLQVARGAVLDVWDAWWFTDGTAGGTRPYWPHSPPYARVYASTGNRVLFEHASDQALWSTDGTAAGTFTLPLPAPATTNLLLQNAGIAWVTRSGPGNRYLAVTDGTIAGTTTVADLQSWPRDGAVAGERPVFASATPDRDVELFRFDWNQRFHLLRNIQHDRAGFWLGNPTPVGARLFGIGAEPGSGHGAVWVTDGTAAGTFAMPVGLQSPPFQLVAHGDRLLFAGQDPAHLGLFATDGTHAGPQPFGPAAAVHHLVSAGGLAFFVSWYTRRFYRSDGTAAGTRWIETATTPVGCETLGDIGLTGGAGGLLRTDFTPGGTFVLDAHPAHLLGRIGDRVVFQTGDVTTVVVRGSDGTLAGTADLMTMPSAASGPGPQVVEWNGALWLAEGFLPRNLWRTDGTPAGSGFAGPLPASVQFGAFRPARDGMYCTGADAAEGRELWRCTGSPAGTHRAVSLLPGPRSGVLDVWPVSIGHRLLLVGFADATGSELYVSDGTSAATRLVADLAPGSASSNPQFLGVAGRRCFFLADDGVHGQELWTIELAELGAAHEQLLWGGCRGSSGQPVLRAASVPFVGNAAFAFRIEHAAANAVVVLGKSTTMLPSVRGTCTVLPGGEVTTFFTVADAAGTARIGVPIPAAASLVGLQVTVQAGVVDAAGAGGGISLTDAEWIVLGA